MSLFKSIKINFLKFRLKHLEKFSKKNDFNLILESCGIRVGKGTIFYSPNSISIDRERPWMLEIGEYCKITKGVTILTHDYSRSVLRYAYHDIVGEAGKTIIGNNVFIGINSIILMGTKIGNNVIVGAGSVVSGNIPDNVVVAGNPAKVIMTLEQFYKKRKEQEIASAKLYFNSYVSAYKRNPRPKEMGPFFYMFAERSMEYIKENNISFMFNGDNIADVESYFFRSEKYFDNYEDFVDEMMK